MAVPLETASADWRMPEPLREEPPKDHWCDLVLTGGVASGVVYPWAIVELARRFRFRNIGGTSVGALAAAIAAASEYGRRCGHPHAYEVLRRLPGELAEPVEGAGAGPPRTRMLSLFQPAPQGRRLFKLLVDALDAYYREAQRDPGGQGTRPSAAKALRRAVGSLNAAYHGSLQAWLFAAGVVGTLACTLPILMRPVLPVAPLAPWVLHLGLLAALLLALAGVCSLAKAVLQDVSVGLIQHDLGLCRGGSTETGRDGRPLPALSDWMHEGIQKAAGLPLDGPPLTFEDLWHAPLRPGGPRPRVDARGSPVERSINLEVVTTNVTHGRPYRLPLMDRDARLFFDPRDWAGFFPRQVMDALVRAAVPYRPASDSDPSAPVGVSGLLELPCGKLPIVVAARLSLSFPLLFAAVPLYAIDYEEQVKERRRLRRCRFSDGGLCSNFPVHFFDSALPRWPTFGIWLQQRSPLRPHAPIWLPEYQGRGRGDSWQRFEPGPAEGSAPAPGGAAGDVDRQPDFRTLLGFLAAVARSAKDWGDQTNMRMPQVRRRVVRVLLERHEGELNIAMEGRLILDMAARYGTAAGVELCRTYAPERPTDEPVQAWREHLWVRLQVLLDGLGGLLKTFDDAAGSRSHNLDVHQLISHARRESPIASRSDGRTLKPEQAQELASLVEQLRRLGAALASRGSLPHEQRPAPELRLRPPL